MMLHNLFISLRSQRNATIRERISAGRSMTLVEHECAIDNCESEKRNERRIRRRAAEDTRDYEH